MEFDCPEPSAHDGAPAGVRPRQAKGRTSIGSASGERAGCETARATPLPSTASHSRRWRPVSTAPNNILEFLVPVVCAASDGAPKNHLGRSPRGPFCVLRYNYVKRPFRFFATRFRHPGMPLVKHHPRCELIATFPRQSDAINLQRARTLPFGRTVAQGTEFSFIPSRPDARWFDEESKVAYGPKLSMTLSTPRQRPTSISNGAQHSVRVLPTADVRAVCQVVTMPGR